MPVCKHTVVLLAPIRHMQHHLTHQMKQAHLAQTVLEQAVALLQRCAAIVHSAVLFV
jgi:hypothetical protein